MTNTSCLTSYCGYTVKQTIEVTNVRVIGCAASCRCLSTLRNSDDSFWSQMSPSNVGSSAHRTQHDGSAPRSSNENVLRSLNDRTLAYYLKFPGSASDLHVLTRLHEIQPKCSAKAAALDILESN